jgi:5-hydroxyisourate hydrolase-like protein (transthyretin family)
MAIQSSKTFTLQLNPLDLTVLNAYIQSQLTREPTEVTITIKKKMTKCSARDDLREAIMGNEKTWKQGIYNFDFENRKYFRRGRELYLTEQQQLFLYKHLVLKMRGQRFYTANLRKKFGKDFLAEVEE